MERDTAERIEARLDKILRLLASSRVEGKTLTEGVEILSALGLDAKDIAAVFGSTPSSVRGRLAEARGKRKGSPRRHKARQQGSGTTE